MNSGQCLIDGALKMISGCLIPSSAIVNDGSLSTTYLGSLLSVSRQVDSVHRLESSCSADLVPRAFATTLLPVSAVFNSCFGHRSTFADSTVCRSAVLNFGAGNSLCMLSRNFFHCS